MKQVDYLIVGQGIAGSVLATEMIRQGLSVQVLDNAYLNTSSQKAAGLYNPITGRKMVKTWMADELFDGLEKYYQELEVQYEATFIYPKTIYRPFYTAEEANDWQGKLSEPAYHSFIDHVSLESTNLSHVANPFGGIYLKNCGYLDLPELIASSRKYFQGMGVYRQEVFDYQGLTFNDGKVHYKDIEADKIIFCEGPRVEENPYWNGLPFKLVKGEIIKISGDLPPDLILNRGVFIVPKKDGFSVGSTYDHTNLNYDPTEKGTNELKKRLSKLFDGSYQILTRVAGIRPATYDRKPFLGLHENQYVGIFNGFGTKGVSLVPYFAKQFINYLTQKSELIKEVDVNRVLRH